MSRKNMKAYIEQEYDGEYRQDKMMAYSDSVTGRKGQKAKKKFTDAEIAEIVKWFEAIGLSPVSVCRDCSYIPSLNDLLNEQDYDINNDKDYDKYNDLWHLDGNFGKLLLQ